MVIKGTRAIKMNEKVGRVKKWEKRGLKVYATLKVNKSQNY
jgi:hypothetical protein